jgi:hypothetical protein
MPWVWHQQLLERYLEHADEHVALGRLGCSRVEDGTIEWLIREILPDRSALAAPERGVQFVAFTHSDGSGLTPWVDSNLPALPQTVVAELFHGTGAFRGTAWGFHRDMQNGHILLLDELVLPGVEMLRVPLRAAPYGSAETSMDAERFSRTAGALGKNGAEVLARMRAHSIAVFGASRNGLFIAEWAARLGIPLLLCDAKALKRSHLAEISLLLGEEDVERPKVESFTRRIGEWSLSLAAVEPLVARADSPAGAAAAKRAALLVDACDTDSGRLAVAMLATIFHKPQLSIATGIHFDAEGRRTLGADVRLALPGDRCLLCLGGLTDYPRALRELAAGPSPASENAWQAERAGSLRSLNQAATAAGLRLIEDLFAGRVRTSRWLRIEWSEDGRYTTREPESGARRADCPLCRKAGEGDAGLGLV